ncbi:BamA/TamA family outer membrane protein [Acidobacteria bacterium AH-259-A15]|nr:BamA/TamA family outer membrane protein [Acidobacteria bacterium AH-259-A15]
MIQRFLYIFGLIVLSTGICWSQERLVDVRFHGNHSVSDDELLGLLELRVGGPLSFRELAEIEQRLLKTGRFEWVDVRKRYRSLERTNQVVLIVAVKEKPPTSEKFLFFPVLDYTDELGLTLGGRVTALDLFGVEDRISFPLTWGGTRQAAAEAHLPLPTPAFDFLVGGGSFSQRENPHFNIEDRRGEVWLGLDKRIGSLSLGLKGGWTGVRFGETDDRFFTFGVEVSFDTRTNLVIPRDAVYAGAGWERMAIGDGGPSFNRFSLDLRGYKGLVGHTVLAAQVYYLGSNGALPDYQKPFLGGSETLRGYSAGRFSGDNLLIGSLEWRVPLISSTSFVRGGLNVFFDTGTIYDHGQSLRKSRFRNGVGAGFFIFAFGLGFKVEAAYDLDDEVKMHFATRFRF